MVISSLPTPQPYVAFTSGLSGWQSIGPTNRELSFTGLGKGSPREGEKEGGREGGREGGGGKQ